MVDHRVMKALDLLRKKAVFADVRLIRSEYRGVGVFDGDFMHNAYSDSTCSPGIGIRVLKDGGWGFSSGGADGWRICVDEALEHAAASARLNRKYGREIRIEPRDGREHREYRFRTPVREDPFSMSPQTIRAFMQEVETRLRRPYINARGFFLEFNRTLKEYGSTEGIHTHQELFHTDGHMYVAGAHKGETFERSYDGFCLTAQGGWERVREWDFPANATRISEELQELMRAPPCPEGRMDVILHPSQLYLQIHENGHGFELDRILGYELGLAGGSFLRPKHVGRLRYGSEKVNIKADATKPGCAGTFGYDDEGTPAQNIYLVRRGIVTNFLSSRQTVMEARLPRRLRSSTGTMRAESDDYVPLIRMTNIYLEPGDDGDLEDLIAATDRGILMMTNRTWSIDNWRRNFHFGTEVGWLIENGKRKHMVRSPNYQGETVAFWNACDMVGSTPALIGVSNCGKGQPGQSMYCGHPVPPARFRDVQVGIKSPQSSPGSCQTADRRTFMGQALLRRGMRCR